ncbi:hypothetical protein ID866_13206, partial [Astraeus odoratus]
SHTDGLGGCGGTGRCRVKGLGGKAVGHSSTAFGDGSGTPVGC